MIRVLASFVLACAVGCGGGAQQAAPKAPPPPPPDPIPATAGPDCKTAAEQLANLALEDHSHHAKFVEDVTARCDEDGWSDEARSCFATAESGPELDGCVAQKLTEAQREGIASLVAPDGDAEAASTDAAAGAPEKPKVKRRTRGATMKKSGADPCMGGEADPCMGGEVDPCMGGE